MYQLSLNNEELLSLRSVLEYIKVEAQDPFTKWGWNETMESLLLKVTLAQIDGQEADVADEEEMRALYKGEVLAGLHDPRPEDTPSLPDPWWHYR